MNCIYLTLSMMVCINSANLVMQHAMCGIKKMPPVQNHSNFYMMWAATNSVWFHEKHWHENLSLMPQNKLWRELKTCQIRHATLHVRQQVGELSRLNVATSVFLNEQKPRHRHTNRVVTMTTVLWSCDSEWGFELMSSQQISCRSHVIPLKCVSGLSHILFFPQRNSPYSASDWSTDLTQT